LGMNDRDFGWTVEMQIKAARSRLRIQEIPTPYRTRIGKSKISGTLVGTVRAGWKILFTIARYGLFSRKRLKANDGDRDSTRHGEANAQPSRNRDIDAPRPRNAR